MKTKPMFVRQLWAVVFLLASVTAHAQMTEGGPRFGLKAGINGTNLYDDANAEDRSGRVGLTGGLFLKIPLGRGHFSLRPELLLATKGATYKLDSLKSSLKFAYLELPLSLEYNLSVVNLHAGLHASYLASSTGEFKDELGNLIKFNKDDLEKLDFGWHVGAGIDLGNIGVHLRVSRGLKDIGGDQTIKELVGSLKNAAWALTLSYGF